jgi:phage baseplate assembly protein W
MNFDVYLEGVPSGNASNRNFIGFGSTFLPKGVKGINKLVSKFIKCLLTPRGSDILDHDYGTNFSNLLVGNVDSSLLNQLATESVNTAVEQLQKYQEEYPVDAQEALSSAEIISLDTTQSAPGVSMRVRVFNTAGETATFLVRGGE